MDKKHYTQIREENLDISSDRLRIRNYLPDLSKNDIDPNTIKLIIISTNTKIEGSIFINFISNFPNLEKITIKGEIELVDGIFNSNNNLTEISFEGIKHLDVEIFDKKVNWKVGILDITNCQIQNIEAIPEIFTELANISINNCNVTQIPGNFFRHSSLSHLDFCKNPIRELPIEILHKAAEYRLEGIEYEDSFLIELKGTQLPDYLQKSIFLDDPVDVGLLKRYFDTE